MEELSTEIKYKWASFGHARENCIDNGQTSITSLQQQDRLKMQKKTYSLSLGYNTMSLHECVV